MVRELTECGECLDLVTCSSQPAWVSRSLLSRILAEFSSERPGVKYEELLFILIFLKCHFYIFIYSYATFTSLPTQKNVKKYIFSLLRPESNVSWSRLRPAHSQPHYAQLLGVQVSDDNNDNDKNNNYNDNDDVQASGTPCLSRTSKTTGAGE